MARAGGERVPMEERERRIRIPSFLSVWWLGGSRSSPPSVAFLLPVWGLVCSFLGDRWTDRGEKCERRRGELHFTSAQRTCDERRTLHSPFVGDGWTDGRADAGKKYRKNAWKGMGAWPQGKRGGERESCCAGCFSVFCTLVFPCVWSAAASSQLT